MYAPAPHHLNLPGSPRIFAAAVEHTIPAGDLRPASAAQRASKGDLRVPDRNQNLSPGNAGEKPKEIT
jgi:hypothetical protein